ERALSEDGTSYCYVDCLVDAAVFASALGIAVAPDAEIVLIDVGAAKGLPLLLAGADLGNLLLGWHHDARLEVLPARDAGARSVRIDTACAEDAVGCRRSDWHGERCHEPCQRHPCLNHNSPPYNTGAAPACQNEAL